MKKKMALLTAVVMTMTALAGCGGSSSSSAAASSKPAESSATSAAAAEDEPNITLRCGITVADTSIAGQALQQFEKEVEEGTNGTVQVDLYYDGTLGNERDMIEGVSMGTQEMFCGSTAPLSNFVDDFTVWDLPFAVDINNMEAAYDVMDGEVGQKMLDGLSEVGIKGLAMAHNGFRFILNRTKEVKTPEDIKGLVIRTMENDIHLAFYKAVGANPTPMASTEAFTALAQGVIDGMDNNLDAFNTQGAFESAKYLTMTGHVFSASIFLMNEDAYNSMSAHQQEVVMTAIKNAADFQRDASTKAMDEIVEKAKTEYGVTVTEVNIDDWKACCDPIYEEYKDQIDPEYYAAFFN